MSAFGASSSAQVEVLKKLLRDCLVGIDDDTADYFQGVIGDSLTGDYNQDVEVMKENLGPFLESYGFVDSDTAAEQKCREICQKLQANGLSSSSATNNSSKKYENDAPKLLDKVVVLSAAMESTFSETEQAAIDALWGFDSIRDKKNETIELTESGSAKFVRKVTKDQKKWLAELEAKFEGDEDESESQISTMLLPDLSSGNREKDILVSNVTIMYGGSILLESADLRFAYGRRYGLVGRNGVGKTTLLKHMANFEIEGFPRHHRVLHVKQVC
jgi:ATP-binding cassette subfamily F protein 3